MHAQGVTGLGMRQGVNEHEGTVCVDPRYNKQVRVGGYTSTQGLAYMRVDGVRARDG